MARNIADVREMIARQGIAAQDRYDLPASDQRFPDGAHYRNEISGIGWPKDIEELVDEMRARNVPIHRVIMGSVVRLTQDDLVGLVNWTVRDTLWLDSGVTTEAKVVDLTIRWPDNWVRDEVRVVTVVAK